jgi:hypothetical protein
MDEENKVPLADAATTPPETNVFDERDAEIAKLIEERDNYKNVALKRLGKLPGDKEFLADDGKELDSIIEEKVKATLLDREIARKQQEKEAEVRRLAKENAELRLALKNRPGSSTGGDSGTSTEVKDNVFSEQQLTVLRKKAESLKADPEKFIERAKQNFLKHR